MWLSDETAWVPNLRFMRVLLDEGSSCFYENLNGRTIHWRFAKGNFWMVLYSKWNEHCTTMVMEIVYPHGIQLATEGSQNYLLAIHPTFILG